MYWNAIYWNVIYFGNVLFGSFRYNMCEFAIKNIPKVDTVGAFIKIVSIPDEE